MLGSPVGSAECVDTMLTRKVKVLRLMDESLGLLTSHDEIFCEIPLPFLKCFLHLSDQRGGEGVSKAYCDLC